MTLLAVNSLECCGSLGRPPIQMMFIDYI